MLALSTIGRGGVVWLVAGAALTAARRMNPSAFLSLVLAILLAVITADQLKPLVGRTRPFVAIPEVAVIGEYPEGAAFPSGHAANAFAAAFVLARYVPALRAGWWALAIAIAYSRVYLGVHYPFDVAGGAIVGVSCAWLAIALVERFGPGQQRRCM